MDGAALSVARVAIIGGAVAPLVVFSLAAWRGRFPAWLALSRRRLLLASLLVAGWVHLVWYVLAHAPGHDALAYWAVDLDRLYDADYGATNLFVYSPAAALVSQPLGLLPQPLFVVAWTTLLFVLVIWLAGREVLVWLAFPPLIWLVFIGNIEILLGVAVVLGFRHPWTWSFVLLTKVTPGVGLLWYIARREWRSLAIALGSTAVIVALVYLLVPGAWGQWFTFLSESRGTDGWIPLVPRLVTAAALVVWGARTDRRWTVVAAAMLAVPHFWFASLGGLVALAALGFSWSTAVSRTTAAGFQSGWPTAWAPGRGTLARGGL